MRSCKWYTSTASLSLQVKGSQNTSQRASSDAIMLKDMDWHRALRSQYFHSSAGGTFSSLQIFTRLLSVYLFKSRMTRLLYDHVNSDPQTVTKIEGFPYFPYTSVVNSSGTGKTRLILEALETLPGVYGNLNSSQSGYPKPNTTLRGYLFPPPNSKQSSMTTSAYEERCMLLLLVAAFLYYLVFTEKGDKRSLVELPLTIHNQRTTPPGNYLGDGREVNDENYQFIGMRKVGTEDQDHADMFWDTVVKSADEILKKGGVSNAKVEGTVSATPPPEEIVKHRDEGLQSLRKRLKHLRGHMSSPKGSTHGVSRNPFTHSKRATETARTQEITNSKITAHSIAEEISNFLTDHSDKANVDMFDPIQFGNLVHLLQNDGDQSMHSPLKVPGLFIALDESRLLTQIPLRSDNPENGASYFRCLRRAVHSIHSKTGVCVFLIFSDTTSKIANFTPVTAPDDSDRTFSPFRVNGTILPPFTSLRTDPLSMRIYHAEEMSSSNNLCRRVVHFSEKWGFPTEDLNVSEMATGFIFSQEWQTARQNTSFSQRSQICSNGPDVNIFTCNDDYFGVGRPIWASLRVHAKKPFKWEDGIMFAKRKLLGGGSDSLRSKGDVGGEDRSLQMLAAVACRVPLQIDPKGLTASQLVASHMAYCQSISHDRRSVNLAYPNEPILATAASLIWREATVEILQVVHKYCFSFVTSQGDVGEICTCILLLLAIDKAYESLTCNPPLALRTSMFEHVELKSFLSALFGMHLTDKWDFSKSRDVKSGRGLASSDAGLYVPQLLQHARVRFKSIKCGGAYLNCRDIPLLYEANIALLTSRHYGRVDIVVPLRLEKCWSYLVVQVKMTTKNAHACEWGGSSIDITMNRNFCVLGNKERCELCEFTSKNHLGLVINTWDGLISKLESPLGKLWTFVENCDLQTPHRKGAITRHRANERTQDGNNNNNIIAQPTRATIIARSIACCDLTKSVEDQFNVLIGDTSHVVETSRALTDLMSIDDEFTRHCKSEFNIMKYVQDATWEVINALRQQ